MDWLGEKEMKVGWEVAKPRWELKNLFRHSISSTKW
jgi:hypothetical protein